MARLQVQSGYFVTADQPVDDDGQPVDRLFLGWYTHKEDWLSTTTTQPTVADADSCLTESTEITYETLMSASKFYTASIAIAKYVSLYDIGTSVSPVGAGSVSGAGRYRADQEVKLTAMPGPGYSFAQWQDGNTANPRTLQNLTESAVFTATFTANVYQVTFDARGGADPSPASKRVTYDAVYGALATTSWEGHAFDGWYTAADGGTKVTAEDVFALTENQTLYARWTADLFTVTYLDATQFGAITLKTERVSWDATATPPPSPSHNGWTFSEWTGWNGFGSVRQDRTYTAEGKNNTYTVRYNARNGSDFPQMETFTCYTSQNLSQNVFAYPGYGFAGWTTDAVSQMVVYADKASVLNLAWSGTADLYAVWTPNPYFVHFEPNGGTGEMLDLSASYGEPFEVPSCAFTREDCAFYAWQFVTNGVTNVVSAGSVVSNLTVTSGGVVPFRALWREFYTVRFDSNGGVGAMADATFERGIVTNLPPNDFSRTGFYFTGWLTNGVPAFADRAEVSDLAGIGETVTLTAAWAGNAYVVRFRPNADDATGEMTDQPFVYGVPQSLSPNGFGRGELWQFEGWSNTVSGVLYTNCEKVNNLSATAGDVVTLDACWRRDVGKLSEAMGCTNLYWHDGDLDGGNTGWEIVTDVPGSQGDRCARHQASEGAQLTAVMCVTNDVLTGGTLTFRWRPEIVDERLEVLTNGVPARAVSSNDDAIQLESWDNEISIVVQQKTSSIEIRTGPEKGYFPEVHSYIDYMTWTPKGEPHEPGPDDAVTISSAAVSGGKFALKFPSKADFDYNLLTNANLLIDSWGVMTNEVGTGGEITFEPQIVEGLPQLFFKVETIQKK